MIPRTPIPDTKIVVHAAITEVKNLIATFSFPVQLAYRARAAIGCQTVCWSGFKFVPNARRYKAQ
jgi:hypothetical protein